MKGGRIRWPNTPTLGSRACTVGFYVDVRSHSTPTVAESKRVTVTRVNVSNHLSTIGKAKIS